MAWCLVKHRDNFAFTFKENMITLLELLWKNILRHIGENLFPSHGLTHTAVRPWSEMMNEN
jgi:hypothetical protein